MTEHEEIINAGKSYLARLRVEINIKRQENDKVMCTMENRIELLRELINALEEKS